MSDEGWDELRRGTDGIAPSPQFAARVIASLEARPAGWRAAFALLERRALVLAGAGALAGALLLAIDLRGLMALTELIAHGLVELPL